MTLHRDDSPQGAAQRPAHSLPRPAGITTEAFPSREGATALAAARSDLAPLTGAALELLRSAGPGRPGFDHCYALQSLMTAFEIAVHIDDPDAAELLPIATLIRSVLTLNDPPCPNALHGGAMVSTTITPSTAESLMLTTADLLTNLGSRIPDLSASTMLFEAFSARRTESPSVQLLRNAMVEVEHHQLLGSEGVARLLLIYGGSLGLELGYPPPHSDESKPLIDYRSELPLPASDKSMYFLPVVEYFLRAIRPDETTVLRDRLHDLRIFTGTFLYLASSASTSGLDQTFFPEQQAGPAYDYAERQYPSADVVLKCPLERRLWFEIRAPLTTATSRRILSPSKPTDSLFPPSDGSTVQPSAPRQAGTVAPAPRFYRDVGCKMRGTLEQAVGRLRLRERQCFLSALEYAVLDRSDQWRYNIETIARYRSTLPTTSGLQLVAAELAKAFGRHS